ncbi:MAG TPA: hypothetical protein VNZ05_07515 [Solirubrobacteraceae bacterium]|nr:hypothetical protein [Solirubrobacteraceae bacterium]
MGSLLCRRRNATVAALTWALAIALSAPAAHAKVYFSAFLAVGGSGVERAAFDGAGLEALASQPAGFADGIALDVPDGRMYWTDTNASVIWSSNLNGSAAQIVLDDFGAEPLGIALDLAAGRMYFTDSDGVKRASLDGSGVELLTKGPARGFIALDPAARRMYWADWPSGAIKAAAMTPEAVVTNLIGKQPAAFGVAVDPAAGKVFWLQLDLGRKKNEKEVIRRANTDGSEVQTLIERPGAGFEGGLAVDPAAGKLYWTEALGHDIASANLDGSGAGVLFGTGQDVPVALAVETRDPRPVNRALPFIEGAAQVGAPLLCQPGTWSGVGPVSFVYQWSASGSPVEGASGSTYVPFAEQAGQSLACVVSASDDVATSAATSAAVTIAGLPLSPGPPAEPAPPAPLIAGIALARLTVSGHAARVPVFTSAPVRATLWAIASRWPHRARREQAHAPATVSITRELLAGRDTITLRRLHANTTYRLVLVVKDRNGRTEEDTATLRVRS